jgi:hypothetical protein
LPPTAAGGIAADPIEDESPVAEAEAERAEALLPSVAEARREPKALEAKAEALALAVLYRVNKRVRRRR